MGPSRKDGVAKNDSSGGHPPTWISYCVAHTVKPGYIGTPYIGNLYISERKSGTAGFWLCISESVLYRDRNGFAENLLGSDVKSVEILLNNTHF